MKEDNYKKGRVYVVKNDLKKNLYKVGKSLNPQARAKQIASAAGLPLEVVYQTPTMLNALAIEKQTQELLKEYHYHGEWYIVEYNKIIEVIKSLEENYQFKEGHQIDLGGIKVEPSIQRLESISYLSPNNTKEIEPLLYKYGKYYYIKVKNKVENCIYKIHNIEDARKLTEINKGLIVSLWT